jgi:CRISPR type IV-associated protein Csf1
MRGSARSPICAACNTVLGKQYMGKLSRCVASLEGLWSIASNDDRSWWLLNPPQPPFVMVVNTSAQQQHLYWRTPVASSRDAFPVRVGTHLGFIRRKVLARALELSPTMLRLMEERASGNARRARAAKRVSASHPFERLCRLFVHPRHGLLKAGAVEVLSSAGTPPEVRIFAQLNATECWALGALCNQKKPLLSMPVPIATPRSSH